MKNVIKFLLLLIFAGILVSCGGKKSEPKNEEEYLNAAKALYDSAITTNDKALFQKSVDMYKDFIAKYPNSEKVTGAYTQIAGIYFDNLQNYPEAINTYKTVFEKFPDKKEGKQALFMVAFIYDETLKDKENAKAFYKKFLDKFPKDTDPNDQMSASAQRMLEVLESGKTIEELILQQNSAGDKDKTNTDKDATKDNVKKEEPKKEEPKKKETKAIDDTKSDSPRDKK